MNRPVTIIEKNIDDLYQSIILEVLKEGDQVTARGLDFKELLFSHLVLLNPRARFVQNSIRKLSKKFLMAEFIWIMSGQESTDMISKYNRNYIQFSDDGKILHGAYGPRLRFWPYTLDYNHYHYFDQLTSCLERLQADHGTRQAVIMILNPGIDFTVTTKDIPCNDLLQFFIRDNKLHMSCYVRSNDINWGFPYDVFHWTMLQELFANILGVELGEYHHFIGSLHIYNKDFEQMNKCLNAEVDHIPMGVMPPQKDLSIIKELAKEERIFRKEKVLPLKQDPYWNTLLEYLK